jgi:hypothetical protein
MKAIFETSVNFYECTRCNYEGDSNINFITLKNLYLLFRYVITWSSCRVRSSYTEEMEIGSMNLPWAPMPEPLKYFYTQSDKRNAGSVNHVLTFLTNQNTSFCGFSIVIYTVNVCIKLDPWVLWLIF